MVPSKCRVLYFVFIMGCPAAHAADCCRLLVGKHCWTVQRYVRESNSKMTQQHHHSHSSLWCLVPQFLNTLYYHKHAKTNSKIFKKNSRIAKILIYGTTHSLLGVFAAQVC